MRRLLLLALLVVPPSARADGVNVTFIDDQPRAVLAILDKRAAQQPITDADWQRVFTSEGYIRLKAREHSMKRAFEDDTFKTFVLSDDLLAKRSRLAATLAEWMKADLGRAAARALAYLPEGTTIRAKVYPSIKPATNSFVFETTTNPAIFMYLEPLPRAEFERTIAHELHHVGYAGVCGDDDPSDAVQWFGAFGEGVATLAAGGPPSKPDVQAEWTKQMQRFDANFTTLDDFFRQVVEGKLTGEAQTRRAYEFFGLVGPWYTVGHRMATIIEQTLGRKTLIDAMCDTRTLPATYNRAAAEWEKTHKGEKLPRWSDALLEKL
ncbi:MAG TPA: DUF5700 domain-containing putative Zn-dependent protease [Thermoanaerobaculia bacterium]